MKDAERVVITGRSGSGKSCYVKEKLKEHTRFIVFDVLEEYGKIPGIKRANTLHDVKKLLKFGWGCGFKIAFIPRGGQEMSELHGLSKMLMEAQLPYKEEKDTRQILLVVEEMNTCFPVDKIPSKYYGFGNVCSRGRHSGIAVLGVAQRSAEINTRFRGNGSYEIFFAPKDHRDLQSITSVISPKYREALSQMKTHEYFKYQDGKVTKGRNNLR